MFGDTLVINLTVRDPDGDPMEIVILKGPRTGRLTGSGTTFVYKAGAGPWTVDTFSYKAFDGRNYGNEALVRIDRLSSPPSPPGFSQVKLSDAGLLQFSLVSQTGLPLRIESTTNFANWVTITNLPSLLGTFLFNTPATNQQIFYRAVQQ
jgi:hypothetical protein